MSDNFCMGWACWVDEPCAFVTHVTLTIYPDSQDLGHATALISLFCTPFLLNLASKPISVAGHGL